MGFAARRLWKMNNNYYSAKCQSFEMLVKVKLEVMARCMHYFTIEIKKGGAKKPHEAKVRRAPEFKRAASDALHILTVYHDE
ncbi:hypothetical protein QYE76_014630 [Lolium multiflorum]|uniref:Uncharacterized protein n=1 Tax=Lolium multiflorum TaxID=4521 RepID=A0AAD8U580_LOLMU|nr:hypothetical protein QYE76_014630 [Lolium multiflorum]